MAAILEQAVTGCGVSIVEIGFQHNCLAFLLHFSHKGLNLDGSID